MFSVLVAWCASVLMTASLASAAEAAFFRGFLMARLKPCPFTEAVPHSGWRGNAGPSTPRFRAPLRMTILLGDDDLWRSEELRPKGHSVSFAFRGAEAPRFHPGGGLPSALSHIPNAGCWVPDPPRLEPLSFGGFGWHGWSRAPFLKPCCFREAVPLQGRTDKV